MQALEQGQVTVAGQQQVDGKTAVVLRLMAEKAMAQLWVDRVTYRPVRIVFGTGASRFTLNVAWVPRTQAVANALATPQVPAGYTHVTRLGRVGPGRPVPAGLRGRARGEVTPRTPPVPGLAGPRTAPRTPATRRTAAGPAGTGPR